MDYSKKPERKNPRKGANGLSQLFFAWVMPTMLQVSTAELNCRQLNLQQQKRH